MDEIYMSMLSLGSEGFYCSQILMSLVLEKENKKNPELIRAMGGLIGGLGFQGKTCGALTGGACMLGYYTAKGEPDEVADPNSGKMIGQLVNWFEQITIEFGGNNCLDILQDDPQNKMLRCPKLVRGVYDKVMEILEEYGYEI